MKTDAGRREVILAPAVVKLLRERWLSSPHKAPDAFVWKRSGITATGRLSLHSLRHGYASLLIAKGLNVVFVSGQLGHANPTVTLSTYAHLFERADHAHTAREALEAGYTAMVGTSG